MVLNKTRSTADFRFKDKALHCAELVVPERKDIGKYAVKEGCSLLSGTAGLTQSLFIASLLDALCL